MFGKWRKKNPMLDGSKPVRICYDPDLHVQWKLKVSIIALLSFGLGMTVQQLWSMR